MRFFIVIVLILVSYSSAFALKCVPESLGQAYGRADVVFTGKIKSVSAVETHNSAQRRMVFSVFDSWKQTLPKEVEVLFKTQNKILFEPSDVLLVFAHRGDSEGQLVVGACGAYGRVDRLYSAVRVLNTRKNTNVAPLSVLESIHVSGGGIPEETQTERCERQMRFYHLPIERCKINSRKER